MVQMALGIMLMFVQLAPTGAGLPQVLTPDFKSPASVAAGKKADVNLKLTILNNYAINRIPPMTLTLNAVPGLTLDKNQFTSPSEDPKSKDEYYVDLPIFKVPVTAAKAGNYEIPGKLVYFFCSKADGFCARQVIDVKIPVTAK